MPFLFAPPAQAVIPVQDERYEYFPVRRVYGIAKNYAAPGTPKPETLEEALVFMKPADGVTPVEDGAVLTVPMPEGSESIVHEIELVACLSKGGRNLTPEEAEEAVWGWCVGIDFTRPEKKVPNGPWEAAKVFEGSAPVSHVRPKHRTPLPAPADIWLYVNNQKRQSGRTDQMLRSPFEVIAEISKTWTLAPGDIVFTGTPAGNGPCRAGDRLEGGVNGVGQIKIELVDPKKA